MKGVVFTEFLEMVEERFTLRVADEIVGKAGSASGGSYTSVGTYPAEEMVRLVVALSESTKIAVPDLLRAFGQHLLGRFAKGYPQFFEVGSAFAFLENVHRYIHVEVKKLYPDAELPTFETDRPAPDRLTMVYRSPRRLADLAEGLILGCAEHFGESLEIAREDLSEGKGEVVRFSIRRNA